MLKNPSTCIVATFMAVFTLFFAGSITTAQEKTKPQPQLTPRQILRSFVTLQNSAVLHQQTPALPPALGGTETVIEWKEFKYTIWLWKYTAAEQQPVEWCRIYSQPLKTAKPEYTRCIGDAKLDGIVDTGFIAAPGVVVSDPYLSMDYVNSMEQDARDAEGDGAPLSEDLKKARAEWQKCYDVILGELAEFLRVNHS